MVTLQNRSTIVAPIDVLSFPKYVEALDVAQRLNTRLAAELRSEQDLVAIAQRQKDFEEAVAKADWLKQGRRMLHLHFEFLERLGRLSADGRA